MTPVQAEIMHLLMIRDMRTAEFAAHGIGRGVAQPALAALVEQGKIYKHSRAKQTYFSLDSRPKVKHPERSRQTIEPLPDLLPTVLYWMGYTSHTPDPDAGTYVYGGQWP